MTLTSGIEMTTASAYQTLLSCNTNLKTTRHLCGHINTNSHNITKWHIRTISGYNTDLFFHQFTSIYSRECQFHSLEVIKTTFCSHSEYYCGYFPPWNETCPCVSVQLILSLKDTHITMQFTMSYQSSQKKQFSGWVHIEEASYSGWPWHKLFDVVNRLMVYIQVRRTRWITLNITCDMKNSPNLGKSITMCMTVFVEWHHPLYHQYKLIFISLALISAELVCVATLLILYWMFTAGSVLAEE